MSLDPKVLKIPIRVDSKMTNYFPKLGEGGEATKQKKMKHQKRISKTT
jgi:hypothetical protein